jgi:perosamine synthetase
LAYGKWGRRFEKKLSDFIGEHKILTLNTYNYASIIALLLLGIGKDDEVVASPMSCLASNQPIVAIGAKVVWADIDPLTGTLDPDNVKSKITLRTKAILHNHFCGYPGYIDEINDISKVHAIPVIDDCIEAFGSEYKGKKLGNTRTDITIFSFNPVRLPNSIDGGAIVLKDNELYEKAALMRDSGINRKNFRDSMGEINPYCDISTVGYGATLNEVNSYIGAKQLEHIEYLLDIQKKNAAAWMEWINQNPDQYNMIKVADYCKPNFWVFGVLCKDKPASLHYFRKMGYYASSVHMPNNIYSVFGGTFDHLPGVHEFYSRFLALPCGWWLENSQGLP